MAFPTKMYFSLSEVSARWHNCVIAPYFAVDVIDWEQLLTSLGIMLGISGVRDIGINRRKKDDGNSKEV